MAGKSFRSSGTNVADAAGGADRVVELFQPADRARDRDHVRAGLRELECGRHADPARSAGDERDAVGERFGHDRSM